MYDLLYIYLGGDFNLVSGVQKKINSKLFHLNNLNFKTHALYVSSAVTEPTWINEYILLLPCNVSKTSAFFGSFKIISAYLSTIINYLEQNNSNYKHVIFRYPTASFTLLKLTKKFKHKIIFEHNTKEIEELENGVKKLKLKFGKINSIGRFILYLETIWLPPRIEKVVGAKIFRNAKFGIAVTDEIGNYESKRQPNYKCFTISNGVDIDHNIILKEKQIADKINLIFVRGFNADWHGSERIINGFMNYPNKQKFHIYFVGENFEKEIKITIDNNLQSYITYTGKQNSEKLTKLYENCHVAIGSLAMHRINLKQGCVLKVREYMSVGLPVIVGYNDVDLVNNIDFKSYYLKVNADESALAFDEILKFCNTVYSIKNVNTNIQHLAKQNFEMSVKVKQLINTLSTN